MAWVFGGKKFGQYTYEHWYDNEEAKELKEHEQSLQNSENYPCKSTKDDELEPKDERLALDT